jgi:hypothetical protein
LDYYWDISISGKEVKRDRFLRIIEFQASNEQSEKFGGGIIANQLGLNMYTWLHNSLKNRKNIGKHGTKILDC